MVLGLETYAAFPTRLVQARRVDVWLPPGYNPRKQRYAVLYMHDGQNLFDSSLSFNKQTWGLGRTLTRLLAQGKIQPTVVVAIWNTPLRFAEYQPAAPFEALEPAQKLALAQEFGYDKVLSDAYLRFIVEELKPFIDRRYATRPEAAHTFLAGSSMGGLVSLYGLCQYPQVFGRAACLSPHWPGSLRNPNRALFDQTLRYLGQHLPPPGTHRLYMDHGSLGLDALYGPFQRQVDSVCAAKGYQPGPTFMSRTFPGADHNERAWANRADLPFWFLLKP